MHGTPFTLAFSLWGLFVAPFVADARDGCDAVVYFIPPGVETYVPVTPESIRRQAFERWCLSSTAQIDKLSSIVSGKTSATFDARRVRMAFLSKNAVRYMDADGIVSTG